MVTANLLPVAQRNTHTKPGRSDTHIAALADGMRPGLPRRILSFGCSEGYECLTLAKVFPDADIFGCDINPDMIAAATRRCNGAARIFPSSAQALSQHGPFDLITAMNVLCLYPQTKHQHQIADLFPFALFEELLAQMDQHLKPGGALFLYNAQYMFEETVLAPRYLPLPTPLMPDHGFLHRHDRSGKRFTEIRYVTHATGEFISEADGLKRMEDAISDGGDREEAFAITGKLASTWEMPPGDLEILAWQKKN